MRRGVCIFVLGVLTIVTVVRPVVAQSNGDNFVRELINCALEGEGEEERFYSELKKLVMCPDNALSEETRAELLMSASTRRRPMGGEEAQSALAAAVREQLEAARKLAHAGERVEVDFRPFGSRATVSELAARFTVELSGYTDTIGIHLLSPSLAVDLEQAADGWGGGARLMLDVSSEPSQSREPDRWETERYSPAIHIHKKFGPLDVALAGALSLEPDYFSVTGGFNTMLGLAQKTVTPSIGYQYSRERIIEVVHRHVYSAGLEAVLSKATLGSAMLTIVVENGDQSGPNRLVPMFAPSVAPLIPKGFSRRELGEKTVGGPWTEERLPSSRQRFGLAVSVAHRFTNATLRVSERGYYDSWGVLATTTDGRFMYDVTTGFQIWPHLRVHYQGNASFYRLAYAAQPGSDGYTPPEYRTINPELGRMLGVSAGGGVRIGFGKRRLSGLMFNGDFVSTLFMNHLFIERRFGFVGTITFVGDLVLRTVSGQRNVVPVEMPIWTYTPSR